MTDLALVKAADETEVDITAVTRLKHADLYAAAKRMGHAQYGGQSRLARRLKVTPQVMGRWINLRDCPPDKPSRTWSRRRLARLEARLIEITGKTMEELFPPALRSSIEFLRAPKVFEQTARLRQEALENYAITTAERLSVPCQPTLAIEAEERSASIVEALASLNWRERQVVEMRYGLGDHRASTLEEVGKALGITRERVRQIEAKAVRKLQQRAAVGLNQLSVHYG